MKILFVTADQYPVFGTTVNILHKIIFEGNLDKSVEKIGVLSFSSDINNNDFTIVNNIYEYKALNYANFTKNEMLAFFKNGQLDVAIKIFLKKILVRILGDRKKDGFIRRDNVYILKRKILNIVNNFDYVVPIFGSYDAALACMQVKKECGIKIALYQVDPCSTNWTVSSKEKNTLKSLEAELYSCADVIFTMPIIYKDVVNIANEKDRYKFHILELPLVINKTFSVSNNVSEKIICAFSGLIYAGIRDPRYTLSLFSDLVKNNIVELWLIGVEKQELPSEYKDLPIKCFGRVPMKEAENYMAQADVLINIGNLMNNQVPSKIFDYISYGKPVINICKTRECPTLPYMTKYPLCLNLHEEQELLEQQKSELENFIRKKHKDRISYDNIKKLFSCCTPEFCADSIVEALQEIRK